MTIEIQVNGEARRIEPDMTLEDLLRRLELPSRRVAVELNRQVVPRERYGATALQAGDRLEIVTLVGGG